MLETIAQFVFLISAALVTYVYLGYPLLIFAVSRLFPKPVMRGDYLPTVTIIITAYNEEKGIEAKIENTFQIDYPADKIEVIVASDGSTDRTDEIVRGMADQFPVQLFRQEGRKGKTFTQNMAVERAKGEIILFSDATTLYQTDVLKALVPNFADAAVGCVAGRLVYFSEGEDAVAKGAKSYWGYESFLRECESRAWSLIGTSGCLYAVRRSAYVPMYPEACSDFLICTVVYRQDLRSVFEPNAVCMEKTNARTDKEFQMRVRVISQTFTDLWRNRDMLNPLKSGLYGAQLLSHKVLRYAVPLFLIAMLVSAFLAAPGSWFFTIVLSLQVIFYLTAGITLVLERLDLKVGPFAIPLYFVLANLSSTLGFYRFLKGERFATWETNR